jgi:hypothetical protein
MVAPIGRLATRSGKVTSSENMVVGDWETYGKHIENIWKRAIAWGWLVNFLRINSHGMKMMKNQLRSAELRQGDEQFLGEKKTGEIWVCLKMVLLCVALNPLNSHQCPH